VETKHTMQEISRLRRCVDDLASLLSLPAMWSGLDRSRVMSTLLAVLVRMLDLDIAYARTTNPDESPREWMRSADSVDRHVEATDVSRTLEPYLAVDMRHDSRPLRAT
jgi:formate hydrogenlyase transcriptional activator